MSATCGFQLNKYANPSPVSVERCHHLLWKVSPSVSGPPDSTKGNDTEQRGSNKSSGLIIYWRSYCCLSLENFSMIMKNRSILLFSLGALILCSITIVSTRLPGKHNRCYIKIGNSSCWSLSTDIWKWKRFSNFFCFGWLGSRYNWTLESCGTIEGDWVFWHFLVSRADTCSVISKKNFLNSSLAVVIMPMMQGLKIARVPSWKNSLNTTQVHIYTPECPLSWQYNGETVLLNVNILLATFIWEEWRVLLKT